MSGVMRTYFRTNPATHPTIAQEDIVPKWHLPDAWGDCFVCDKAFKPGEVTVAIVLGREDPSSWTTTCIMIHKSCSGRE